MQPTSEAPCRAPRAPLLAAALVLLGPLFAGLAASAVTDGLPLSLVLEAGALGHVALGIALTATLATAGTLVFVPREDNAPASLVGLSGLLSWCVLAVAVVLGADLVREAAVNVDLPSRRSLTAMGAAELMGARALGACLVAGHALALSVALLVVGYASPKGSRVRAAGVLGGLAWLSVALVVGGVMADARVLRLVLRRIGELGPDQLEATLTLGLPAAQRSARGLLSGVIGGAVLGASIAYWAWNALRRSAFVVALPWLAGMCLMAGDALTMKGAADVLGLPAPPADAADVAPLDVHSRDTVPVTVSAEPPPPTPSEPVEGASFGPLGTAEPAAAELPEDPEPATAATRAPAAAAGPPVPLDPATISRVVRGHAPAVRACYDRALASDPGLGGRIDVSFSILPNGRVARVTTAGSLSAPAVVRCVRAEVATWTFPASAGRAAMAVTYPFIFRSSR